MAAMDSCFVSLKSDTQLMKGNWGGFDRCENRFFGEKVRGGFSENVWIRSLKSEKKALKLTPNVTYAVATPNVSKQPMTIQVPTVPKVKANPKNVASIILGGGAGTHLFPLTKRSATPAVPVGGCYRLIDIPMSNCINSGINKIFVLTQFNSASLNRHIARTYFGNGVTFGEGFVEVLAATQTSGESGMYWFQGTADAVRQFIWVFEDAKHRNVENILILAGDHMYRMDYMDFVQNHIDRKADISISCAAVDDSRASDYGLVKLDSRGRIIQFSEKPEGANLNAMRVDTTPFGLSREESLKSPYIASMGVYVFKTEVLLNLLKWRYPTSNDFGSEIIPAAIKEYNVQAFMFRDYWEDIGTIKTFYDANMALTEEFPKFEFYDPKTPFYTSPRFLPPTKIDRCQIVDAIISHGCFLRDCSVQHSIVGERSRLDYGVELKDTIMMGADNYQTELEITGLLAEGKVPVGIGRNSKIKKCIIDKNAKIGSLGHLATYASTFPAVASHAEILELSIQLAMSSLEIVYTHFYQYVDRRLSYHCDLLTRGMGGVEMESRKAEEWASQLQCWSLQLINCFAFKPEFLPTICKPEFLVKLPGMWGGLVNENSPAGIGLLRTICHHKLGRGPVANCPSIIEALCNIARSSDDWQSMAIDCLMWLLQDPNTSHKVIDKAAPTLLDLAEISSLGDHRKLGESITNVLQECIQSQGAGRNSISNRTKEQIEELLKSRQRLKWEKSMPKEDLRIKQAAALVIKLEGNSMFSSGNISAAASKYSEALALCPMRSKKERVVLYSNRAQCYLLLQQPIAAIGDATRALCLHNPVNRHAKSLWRRAQAYDMLGLAKESLLDAILFINECSQSNDPDLSLRQNKVPDYAERLVKKQMRAAWLFREAAIKHGNVQCEDGAGDVYGRETDDSEWETASESDIGNDGRDEMGEEEEDDEDCDWKDEDKYDKSSIKEM